jgi:hypothetical protein
LELAIEIARVAQRQQASAAGLIGGAGDGITADLLACTVDDREMKRVAVCF